MVTPLRNMRRLLAGGIRRFKRDSAGASAIEFALVTPIMITMILGASEIERYYRYDRHMIMAAKHFSQVLANSVAETGELQRSMLDSAMASVIMNFPELTAEAARSGQTWQQTLTSGGMLIRFTPTVVGCTAGCSYTGASEWTWGTSQSCGAITGASAGTAAGALTIPSGLFGPGVLFKTDLFLTYTPQFDTILPAFQMQRTGYATPVSTNNATLAGDPGVISISACS